MAKSSHRVRVHADPATVFELLTSEAGIKGWFTPKLEGKLEQGGEIRMEFAGAEPFRWRIAEIKPQQQVRWECLEGPGAASGTSVLFVLTQGGPGQTVVEMDHDDWPEGHAALATCNTMWGMLLGRMKERAETGSSQPVFQ